MTPKPLLIIMIVLLLLLFSGCGEDPQPAKKPAPPPAAAHSQPPAAEKRPQSPQAAPAPSPSPPPVVTQPAPPAETQALQQPLLPAKEKLWPFISDELSGGALAENLTARNFFLIFDGSGSMLESECAGGSRKIDVAKKAVAAWSKSIPANANLGLYAFHNKGILTLPLATGNRDTFIAAVSRISAGGNTPLGEAMMHAYQVFTEQARRQLGYGEYTIVVVTDGIASNIDELQRAVRKILTLTPISIYSIGFCIRSNHSLNQPGRTLYKSADNPQQLQQGLKEVLAESESFDEREFSK